MSTKDDKQTQAEERKAARSASAKKKDAEKSAELEEIAEKEEKLEEKEEEIDQQEVQEEERSFPVILRIYGILCLLAAAYSTVETVVEIVGFIYMYLTGQLTGSIISLSNILFIIDLLLDVVLVAALIVFGIELIRKHRRHIARLAYIRIALSLAAALLDLMLVGLDVSILSHVVNIALMLIIAITIDPSLREERRVQRKLRKMDTHTRAEEGTLGRDLTGKGYISLDPFNMFWIFTVCCVLGLVIETLFCLITNGYSVNRAGLLYGPFSPIYGFGALLMTIALNRFYKRNFLIIFVVSGLIGGIFEFAVSWFLQNAFGIVAWDYKGTFLNIDGRTDLFHIIAWGILGLIWIKFILPYLLKLINLIPWQWRYAVTAVAATLMIIDGVMTMGAFDCWYERIDGQQPTTPVEQFYADYYNNDYMQNRFQTMSISSDRSTRQ
ncbi:MAG: putative ABC transporter permease [Coriobacteriaceae bacterium]|nr:putative ABC transporter permease [Coriobacteriaceae bacterium]